MRQSSYPGSHGQNRTVPSKHQQTSMQKQSSLFSSRNHLGNVAQQDHMIQSSSLGSHGQNRTVPSKHQQALTQKQPSLFSNKSHLGAIHQRGHAIQNQTRLQHWQGEEDGGDKAPPVLTPNWRVYDPDMPPINLYDYPCKKKKEVWIWRGYISSVWFFSETVPFPYNNAAEFFLEGEMANKNDVPDLLSADIDPFNPPKSPFKPFDLVLGYNTPYGQFVGDLVNLPSGRHNFPPFNRRLSSGISTKLMEDLINYTLSDASREESNPSPYVTYLRDATMFLLYIDVNISYPWPWCPPTTFFIREIFFRGFRDRKSPPKTCEVNYR